jgi:hypothetical protein
MPSKWLTAFRATEPCFPQSPVANSANSANRSSAAPKSEDFRQFRPGEPHGDGALPIAANSANRSPAPTQGKAIGTIGTYWQNGTDPEPVGAKPAEILEFRPDHRPIGTIGTIGTGVSAETDPAILPDVPPDPNPSAASPVSVEALRADLKAAFADDGPASHAATERLAKVTVTDSPAGDDRPALREWMTGRYVYRLRRGFSRAEAWRIVWGEAEDEWHQRHGAVPEPDRCAGCGERLMPGEGLELPDGAVVHLGDPEVVECPAVYGAQWRGSASVALMRLGLMRPWL